MKLLYLFFLFVITPASSQLHHQMISSQGTTSLTNSDIIVTQTIGQQSVIGNYDNQYLKLGQGYQQVNWSRIIIEQTNPEFEVSIYPNPFEEIINIKHNTDQDINIKIFNPAGRLVYKSLINVTSSESSINLTQLQSGVYLIYIQSNYLKHFTKLIKK